MQIENPDDDLIGEVVVSLANLRQYPLNHIQMDLLEVIKHLVANIDAQAQIRASTPRVITHAEFQLKRAKAREATSVLIQRELTELEMTFVQDLDCMPVTGCGNQIEYIPADWVRKYKETGMAPQGESLAWLKDVYDGHWQLGTILEVSLYCGEGVMHWQYRVPGDLWLTSDTIRQREV